MIYRNYDLALPAARRGVYSVSTRPPWPRLLAALGRVVRSEDGAAEQILDNGMLAR